jgi:hypothetical protein
VHSFRNECIQCARKKVLYHFGAALAVPEAAIDKEMSIKEAVEKLLGGEPPAFLSQANTFYKQVSLSYTLFALHS